MAFDTLVFAYPVAAEISPRPAPSRAIVRMILSRCGLAVRPPRLPGRRAKSHEIEGFAGAASVKVHGGQTVTRPL